LIYRFEDFSLDSDRRELRRGGEIVAIEPQVFDILEFLIVNRERVVGNGDLIRAVWLGRIVSDGTVSTGSMRSAMHLPTVARNNG
jgi:DNA-binding winged helix-turn-helix (wHTH) protein